MACPNHNRGWQPAHGDPVDAEIKLIFETPDPEPNEALVYVLASEMNFNDIWAITGIPVSPFDARDADVQVTGSGGVAMIVRLGSELIAEGPFNGRRSLHRVLGTKRATLARSGSRPHGR